MPSILTHRVSGVHAASPEPRAEAAKPISPRQAGAQPQGPTPHGASAPSPANPATPPAAQASLVWATHLLASEAGRAVAEQMADQGVDSPSPQRIAELIDGLPTYPFQGDPSMRTLTDPALWADQLAAATSLARRDEAADVTSPFYGDNATALVFFTLLQAQLELTEEKRDTIELLRMFGGMVDALSKLTARELLPAMSEANRLTAHEKDAARLDRIEVKVTFPKDIDTKWAHLDRKTGEVRLIMDLGDAPQRLETVQGITALMTLADQWRTSIQNQQSQQSTRFQAQDTASTATLNVANGVLKISHEGASNSGRNISA